MRRWSLRVRLRTNTLDHRIFGEAVEGLNYKGPDLSAIADASLAHLKPTVTVHRAQVYYHNGYIGVALAAFAVRCAVRRTQGIIFMKGGLGGVLVIYLCTLSASYSVCLIHYLSISTRTASAQSVPPAPHTNCACGRAKAALTRVAHVKSKVTPVPMSYAGAPNDSYI